MDELVFVRGGDFEEAVDDAIGVDAVAFGGEIHDDPMAEKLAELWAQAGANGIAAALLGPNGTFAHTWQAVAV